MRIPAIHFDRQVLSTPEEVHFVSIQSRIDFWLGKAVTATEAEQPLLQLGAGAIDLE